jgi:hypothetical protein
MMTLPFIELRDLQCLLLPLWRLAASGLYPWYLNLEWNSGTRTWPWTKRFLSKGTVTTAIHPQMDLAYSGDRPNARCDIGQLDKGNTAEQPSFFLSHQELKPKGAV